MPKHPNFEPKLAEESVYYKQCVGLYNAMDSSAEYAEINGEKIKMWRGPLTQLAQKLGIPTGSYSKVKRTLADLGCITVSSEGRTQAGSTVFLHYSPESLAWDTKEERERRRLTPRGESAMLRQQVADVLTSLGGLNVKDALVDLQKQITSLTQEVELLKKERTVGKKEKSTTRNTATK